MCRDGWSGQRPRVGLAAPRTILACCRSKAEDGTDAGSSGLRAKVPQVNQQTVLLVRTGFRRREYPLGDHKLHHWRLLDLLVHLRFDKLSTRC